MESALEQKAPLTDAQQSQVKKDMELFVAAAEAQGIDATVAAGVSEVTKKAIAQGLADEDYSAIYNAVNPKG